MEQHVVYVEIDMQKELSTLKVGQSYSYIVEKAKRCLEYRLGSPYVNDRYCNVVEYRAVEEPQMYLKVNITFGLVEKYVQRVCNS